MPLKKLELRPGVNRENTRYTTEGGWYESDKIRFRQGSPEKIGGWERISADTYLGVCRSLWNWVTLANQNLVSVGTNLKYYLERGGAYYDITPLRRTAALTNPFDTTDTNTVVTVTDVAHGCFTGDYVTFSGASAVGGLTIAGEYSLIVLTVDTYTIEAASAATSTATGGGSVSAAYQINVGYAFTVPGLGWGAGRFGSGVWGFGGGAASTIRLWSQANFGEDLVFNHRGGALYYWDATNTVSTRGILVSALAGASDVPTKVLTVAVSDISRFTFAMGCTPLGSTVLDPMLIRWADQENIAMWTPDPLNQAGDLRLSRGAEIVTSAQARQEVLVWTDAALYSLQYLGAPEGWGAQLLGDNTSIASQNAVAYVAGTAFWMGKDKFYKYDGTVAPLPCDLRKHVFGDMNKQQYAQIIAGTNEGYHEIWWFYCSADSRTIDSYVVYHYLENLWYYGSMARTAWLDTSLRSNPIAAGYNYNLIYHEVGNDDKETSTTLPISAYILSSEFDLDDGHQFAFIWRVLPDMSFTGSESTAPTALMTLYPLKNSGSGYTSPTSTGGVNSGDVTLTAALPIEEFTGEVFVRVRGRQMAMKVSSSELGVNWQLGAPRIDLRPDGRR